MSSAAVTPDLAIEQRAPIPTWFGVGGGADRLARPRSTAELRRCLEIDHGLRVLGDGANLLVDDDGVGDLVVSLSAPEFTRFEIDPSSGVVHAGGAVKLPSLINRTTDAGLAGLETLAGFPATIGGAVVMNAGGKYGEIADHLVRVWAVDRSGREHVLERSSIGFGYRRSGLNDLIVTAAEFQLSPDDPGRLKSFKHEVMEYKRQTQPLAENSAGCCYKNPTLANDLRLPDPDAGARQFVRGQRVSAGLLIDRAGCKGMRLGSALVSQQHGNFITADNGGKARDVILLIDQVAARVREEFGVELQTEVVIWRRTP
jgi:UDP-N-acetylmuramate dehydrogenase